MKKLLFAVAFSATAVAFGEEAKCEATCADAKCCAEATATACSEKPAVPVPVAAQPESGKPAAAPKAPMTPEQQKAEREARRAAHKAAREAAEKKAAEKQGITVEELRAKRKAQHEEMMAKRFGMTVEEFKKLTPEQRKAKNMEMRDKMMAKRMGVTVEEFKKLSPEERSAKMKAARDKQKAERKAAMEAKATGSAETKPVEAPKVPEAPKAE